MFTPKLDRQFQYSRGTDYFSIQSRYVNGHFTAGKFI